MYTEDDLRNAVASGAISAEAADALRNSVQAGRKAPASDEEHFRLVSSFNDIFVTIAAILLMVAMAGIGADPARLDHRIERPFRHRMGKAEAMAQDGGAAAHRVRPDLGQDGQEPLAANQPEQLVHTAPGDRHAGVHS